MPSECRRKVLFASFLLFSGLAGLRLFDVLSLMHLAEGTPVEPTKMTSPTLSYAPA
jgi:hypothetical protein